MSSRWLVEPHLLGETFFLGVADIALLTMRAISSCICVVLGHLCQSGFLRSHIENAPLSGELAFPVFLFLAGHRFLLKWFFVARNKYNGKTISFIKVLSLAYINIDLYQNKKTTPKEIQKEMENYRKLRNEKFNAYCGINQDVNPDDFEFDEKKIDVDFTSGPTGYCYSAGEVGISSDGGVYVGDNEIFNVRDYMNVYVNGQEVEI